MARFLLYTNPVKGTSYNRFFTVLLTTFLRFQSLCRFFTWRMRFKVFRCRYMSFLILNIVLSNSRTFWRQVLHLMQIMLSVLRSFWVKLAICCLGTVEVSPWTWLLIFLGFIDGCLCYCGPWASIKFSWKRTILLLGLVCSGSWNELFDF